MGLGRKFQTCICSNVNLEQQQQSSRSKDVSNLMSKRVLCRAFFKSMFGLFKKQKHLSTTDEHIFASILPPRGESVMGELRDSTSSNSSNTVDMKQEEQQRKLNRVMSSQDEENAKRDVLLVSLQGRIDDIIQRLMRSYGQDEEPETALLGPPTPPRGIAGSGPNSWERRVQTAIDRLSRIHSM